MSNIQPKLTAALTTIALLAPAAGAQATTLRTLHPARHFTISQPERHFTPHHPRRSPARFHCDSRSI
jgi:hypothetical protein